MLGFVTAMETFCGQAFGAQRYKMVGLVLQRGLIISFMYCCAALWTWQFNGAMLVWMGQVGTGIHIWPRSGGEGRQGGGGSSISRSAVLRCGRGSSMEPCWDA